MSRSIEKFSIFLWSLMSYTYSIILRAGVIITLLHFSVLFENNIFSRKFVNLLCGFEISRDTERHHCTDYKNSELILSIYFCRVCIAPLAVPTCEDWFSCLIPMKTTCKTKKKFRGMWELPSLAKVRIVSFLFYLALCCVFRSAEPHWCSGGRGGG